MNTTESGLFSGKLAMCQHKRLATKCAHNILLGMILLLGVVPFAAAENAGWYIGGGFGSADDDKLDDRGTAFKIFGGYWFNPRLALEAAAIGLGDNIGPQDLIKDGIAVEVLGAVPVGERFELFAKAGFFLWEVRVETDDLECSDFGSGFICFFEKDEIDDGVDPAYGIGVQYRFHDRWNVRGEWERFKNVGESDVDLVSVNIVFRF
jgi:OOP family OmpA-OmpF porin